MSFASSIATGQFSYTVEIGRNNAKALNVALTGDENKRLNGPVKEGQTVEIGFSESQMRALMNDTRNSARGSQNGNAPLADMTGYDVGGQRFYKDDVTAEDFAIDLARSRGGDNMGIAAKLFVIADNVGGAPGGGVDYAIDASVTVVN